MGIKVLDRVARQKIAPVHPENPGTLTKPCEDEGFCVYGEGQSCCGIMRPSDHNRADFLRNNAPLRSQQGRVSAE